jgi:hypothetical protein
LNHVPGGTINGQRCIAADAIALISATAFGAQRTWRNLPPFRGQSKMPHCGKSRLLANGCVLTWEELIDDQRLDEDRVLVSEACAESGRDDQPAE